MKITAGHLPPAVEQRRHNTAQKNRALQERIGPLVRFSGLQQLGFEWESEHLKRKSEDAIRQFIIGHQRRHLHPFGIPFRVKELTRVQFDRRRQGSLREKFHPPFFHRGIIPK